MRKRQTYNLLTTLLPFIENCGVEHFKNNNHKEMIIETVKLEIAKHQLLPTTFNLRKENQITHKEIKVILGLKDGLDINEIAYVLGVSLSVLQGKYRGADDVNHRMFSMSYFYGQGFTYDEIGKLHKKDHATALHAVKCLKQRYEARDAKMLSTLCRIKYKYE